MYFKFRVYNLPVDIWNVDDDDNSGGGIDGDDDKNRIRFTGAWQKIRKIESFADGNSILVLLNVTCFYSMSIVISIHHTLGYVRSMCTTHTLDSVFFTFSLSNVHPLIIWWQEKNQTEHKRSDKHFWQTSSNTKQKQ